MNHKQKGRKFGVGSAYNKALQKNMSKSLIQHEQITTTLAKAKELRISVEKLITLGKRGELSNRRKVIAYMGGNCIEVKKLFADLAMRYKDRNGGYTRIVKAGYRAGDSAPMAIIQLV